MPFARNRSPIARDCARPCSDKFRWVLQSPSLKPGGSPEPGAAAWRSSAMASPDRKAAQSGPEACALPKAVAPSDRTRNRRRPIRILFLTFPIAVLASTGKLLQVASLVEQCRVLVLDGFAVHDPQTSRSDLGVPAVGCRRALKSRHSQASCRTLSNEKGFSMEAGHSVDVGRTGTMVSCGEHSGRRLN